MNLRPEQLAAHLRRAPEAEPAQKPAAKRLPVATGALREPDMNKTEAEYAQMKAKILAAS